LTWLCVTHHRTVVTCTQQDVDEYLASGPTTRHAIRTFFVWAKRNSESLAYRVAGTLLMLYAEPLVRIAALKTAAVVLSSHETRITLGDEPVPVPHPFAGMLTHHLNNRPNLRTGGGMVANAWLFPGYHPGKHLDPQSIMQRLRKLDVNLLGARNSGCTALAAARPRKPKPTTTRASTPAATPGTSRGWLSPSQRNWCSG
jgi:hypothetical protein